MPGVRLARSRPQAERIAKRFAITTPESLLQQLPQSDTSPSNEQALEAFVRLADRFRELGAPGIHLFVLSDTELATMMLRELTAQVPA